MRVSEAKAIASQWVREHAPQIPGFCGGLFHGSINWRDDAETLAPTSDVDLTLIVSGAESPKKIGKFVYQGVLLDVSFLCREQIADPEAVLATSHLAGSVARSPVLSDPTGWLTGLQTEVARNYPKEEWVLARCRDAEAKVRRHLAGFTVSASLPAQVTSCLFAAGITTHILLVAGLENPTVRRRYLDVRNLLTRYGHADFYPFLLELLGCTAMTASQVRQHLDTLTPAFDAAASVLKSPFPFAGDITAQSRHVALGGSRDLIEQGDYHEAVFWIAVTYSRCQIVLEQDAPAILHAKYREGYEALTKDLGLATVVDRIIRCQQVETALPRINGVAKAIIAANSSVEK